jgi:hypothetical protein
MAWTNPATVAAGDTLAAAFWNEQVRDNSEYLKDEADNVGLVHITTQTFTTSGAVNVNNCFTSAYDNYKIILFGLGTVNTDLYFRVRLSGTDAAGASDYVTQDVRLSTTSVTAARSTSSAFIGVSFTSDPMFMDMTVFRPAIAATTGIQYSSGGGAYLTLLGGGRHGLNTAYDGFSLIPASGTITGTVRVFGMRNS